MRVLRALNVTGKLAYASFIGLLIIYFENNAQPGFDMSKRFFYNQNKNMSQEGEGC